MKNFKQPELSSFAATLRDLLVADLAADPNSRWMAGESEVNVRDQHQGFVVVMTTGVRGGAERVHAILSHLGYDLFPLENTLLTSRVVIVLKPGYMHRYLEERIYVIRALVSYENREAAKEAGFTWVRERGAWMKEVSEDEYLKLGDTSFFKFELDRTFTQPADRAVVEEHDELVAKVKEEVTTYVASKRSSAPGANLAAMRKTFGGPVKVLKPCPHCQAAFGVADMRTHKPRCTKNPLVVKRSARATI
jgi:hypothetical protein